MFFVAAHRSHLTAKVYGPNCPICYTPLLQAVWWRWSGHGLVMLLATNRFLDHQAAGAGSDWRSTTVQKRLRTSTERLFGHGGTQILNETKMRCSSIWRCSKKQQLDGSGGCFLLVSSTDVLQELVDWQ